MAYYYGNRRYGWGGWPYGGGWGWGSLLWNGDGSHCCWGGNGWSGWNGGYWGHHGHHWYY